MLYSKTGKFFSDDTEFQNIKTLKEIDYNKPVTFYHHPYDRLQHNISLSDALDAEHWEYLKNNPTVQLIHDTNSETFEIFLVNDIVTILSIHKINPDQIKVIVMDQNHKKFLEVQLARRGVTGVNIDIKNYLLKNVVIQNSNNSPSKKFSALSRNYRIWRLAMYAELCDRGLLEYFNYSFHTISPYAAIPKPKTVNSMVDDLSKTGRQFVSKRVLKWLKRCPHNLKVQNNIRQKWSSVTYDTIQSANFHLIIETHYDQQEYFQHHPTFSREFAPSSITEKAYKAIACSTPFIVFSTPYWLEDLRALGFKTYAPYINELYDEEVDSVKRLNMIADEIERICSLDGKNYAELVKNCKMIAAENLEILRKQINEL